MNAPTRRLSQEEMDDYATRLLAARAAADGAISVYDLEAIEDDPSLAYQVTEFVTWLGDAR